MRDAQGGNTSSHGDYTSIVDTYKITGLSMFSQVDVSLVHAPIVLMYNCIHHEYSWRVRIYLLLAVFEYVTLVMCTCLDLLYL